MSAFFCGCDVEAKHMCEHHFNEAKPYMSAYKRDFYDGVNNAQTGQAACKDPDPTGEIRIKDALTGGEKGSKLARFDLIPTRALWLLAEVYGRGARKYADRNWEKGYAWGLSIAALERHFNAWKDGETIDAETGCHHLAQVAWHAFTLLTYQFYRLGTDDRSMVGKAKAPTPAQCEAIGKDTGFRITKDMCEKATKMHQETWKHPEWNPGLPPTSASFPLGQSQNPTTREHISEKVSASQLKRDGIEEGSYRITVERERY